MSSNSQIRLKRLAGLLADRQLDLLLVTEMVNVRYLSGFSGSNALCVIGPDRQLLLTDFRYTDQAGDEVTGFDVLTVAQELIGSVGKEVAKLGRLRLGYDEAHLSVASFRKLRKTLPGQVELVEAAGLVEELRAQKDEHELTAIARAASVADRAFESVLAQGLVGHSESEIAWRLEQAMREAGATAASFPPIVAAGKNGALPHAGAGAAVIEPNTLVVIDWGCVVDGYCSDCTRTVATGEVGEQMESVFGLVLLAQQAALACVKEGAGAREVDRVARRLIEDAGYGSQFGHGTGHGVGLAIHEQPRLNRTADGELAVGNVVTVEPGIYLTGMFGVRIEDLVVVESDGARVLTGAERSMRVVG